MYEVQDDLPVRHRKKRAEKPRKKDVCPGNDDGKHIYVWIKNVYTRDSKAVHRDGRWVREPVERYISRVSYIYTCIGCDKRKRKAYGFEPEECYETRMVDSSHMKAWWLT